MFYILTENMYKREHAIGFFSKVRLACKREAQVNFAETYNSVGCAGNHLLGGLQSGLYRDISAVSRKRIRKDADGVQYVMRLQQPTASQSLPVSHLLCRLLLDTARRLARDPRKTALRTWSYRLRIVLDQERA